MLSMNFAGLPAPVVTTGTFSSMTIFATSGAFGLSSMTFTPNGRSVRAFTSRICSLTTSGGALAAPMIPSPPRSTPLPPGDIPPPMPYHPNDRIFCSKQSAYPCFHASPLFFLPVCFLTLKHRYVPAAVFAYAVTPRFFKYVITSPTVTIDSRSSDGISTPNSHPAP